MYGHEYQLQQYKKYIPSPSGRGSKWDSSEVNGGFRLPIKLRERQLFYKADVQTGNRKGQEVVELPHMLMRQGKSRLGCERQVTALTRTWWTESKYDVANRPQ